MSEPVLLTGGPIRTMSDLDTPEAILVHDGRILAIGSTVECRRISPSTPRPVDLDGRALMPGFVDAHTHTILHGSGLDWAELSDCKTIDDIVSALQAWGRANPSAEAIRGYGYDQSQLLDGRHPTASDLDRVDPSRGVWIQHASGHGYVVNSAVLRTSGISADTPTPPGGRMDRDESGNPTGLVFDSACDLLTGANGVKITNHGPNFHLPMSDSEIARLFELGQAASLAAGITTICDAQVTELEMRAYLSARDEGRLRTRAHLLALSSNLDHLRGLGLASRLGDDRLELLGVKLYADGSVIARTAFLSRPCCEDPTPHGSLYHEPDELKSLIIAAHELGLGTATHAQGEVPIGLVLDAVEEARTRYPRALTHRIEHCGFSTDEQVARMAELDVVPVSQPTQVHLFGDSLMRDFGEYGGGFYPYGRWAKHGVPVVISSDAPVTQPAPLFAAWAAITRETLSGVQAGGDDLRISTVDAIRGITSAPADLLGRRDLGRLEVGARADLVLLDADPLAEPVEELPQIGVTETWVAGEVAWSAVD